MSVQTEIQTDQYLAFSLADETFAFEINRVREVLEVIKVTKVPQTPRMMKGVINLRGKVVPVIDMRLKFGMQEGEQTVNTVIIIIEVLLGEESTLIGALVDSVKEVMNLGTDQIEPAPAIGTQLDTDYIRGMGKRDGEFVILLDIEKIFSSRELEIVQQISEELPA